MKATLVRVEGEMAVLLVRDYDNIRLNLPMFLLPCGSKEGDILDISITRDEKETEESKARVSNMIEQLKEKARQCRPDLILPKD